jgi:hypothetical protein
MDDPTNVNPEPTPAEPEPTLLSEPTPAEPPKPAEPTVLDAQVSLVKPDGTFIEGWKDKLPEEIRNEECLNLVPDFNEMVKQFVNQRKAIGKNKVAIPTDKSDENEWNSFYEAIGRPKTETGYNVPEIPEELSGIFTDDRLERAKQRAYKIGATQRQFTDFMNGEIEEATQAIHDQDELELKTKRDDALEAEKVLRGEFGEAYDERIHLAKKVVAEGIDKEEDRLRFIEKHGRDVDVIRLLSYVGSRTKEHEALIGELTQKTPTEIQDKIKAIENNPDWRNINSGMSTDERDRLTKELREYYTILEKYKQPQT